MATSTPRPAVLDAQLYSTTPIRDKGLIVLSFDVDGASRPFRALLDSGATNNCFHADSLYILLSRLRVRDSPGAIIVRYADGKPPTHRQRSVVLP